VVCQGSPNELEGEAAIIVDRCPEGQGIGLQGSRRSDTSEAASSTQSRRTLNSSLTSTSPSRKA
jgi:hypothetical protein